MVRVRPKARGRALVAPMSSADGRDESPEERSEREYNFKKGMEKKGGRTKGTQNKVSVALKEAVLLAAAQTGYDGHGRDGLVGYLRKLARTEKRVFGSLLGRVIPLHVTGSVDHQHRELRSRDDILKEMEKRGLPLETIYNFDLKQYEVRDDDGDDDAVDADFVEVDDEDEDVAA